MRQLSMRSLTAAVVAAVLVLCSFFALPVFLGRVAVHGDLGYYHLPIPDFYARCLRQGEAFDWMPQIFGGFFVTGEGQHGPYHPAHWLLYRWLPLDTAFALEVFLPVVVLAAGMVFFLRKYVHLAGTWMGALIATFSVMFAVHLKQPQISLIVAHIPWFLAAIDGAVEAPTTARRRLACAAVALLTGSQVLLGHPQALWFSLLTGALFAVWRLVGERAGWGAWAAVIGGISLGLWVGAVQLFTTYSMFANSTRATVHVALMPHPTVDPRSYCGIIAPYMTWRSGMRWMGSYFGAVPLVLALWWITLPVVGHLRGPHRYLILTQISVAILAACAFARLVSSVRAGRKEPWSRLALPRLAVGASVVLAVWSAAQANNLPRHRDFQAQFFTGPLFVGGAAAALTLAARGRQLGLFLLVVLTAIDLGVYSIGGEGKVCWWNLPSYEEHLARCSGPPTSHEGRVFDGKIDGWVDVVDSLCFNGYRTINGYAGLDPTRSLDYRHINTLRVAEVAWFRGATEAKSHPAGLGPPLESGWCRVPNPLPRARLVSNVQVSAAPGTDLKKIDVDTTTLISRPLELTPSVPGTAKLLEDRPGKIAVEVAVPARQLLVLSESYHHDWQVHVDGQPAGLEQVNGDFMGCVVEQGNHRVEFAFLPLSLHLGRIVSLAALAVCLAMACGPGIGLVRGLRSPLTP